MVEQGGVIRSLLTVELQGEVARGSCLATKRYNNFGDEIIAVLCLRFILGEGSLELVWGLCL